MRYIKTISVLLIILGSFFTLTSCTEKDIEVIVSFDTNGGTDVKSLTYNGVNEIAIPESPIREGYTFDGWFWDNNTFELPFTINSIIDQPNPNDGELTVYAKWTINQYTITFDNNEGSLTTAITQDYNTPVIKPVEPIKEGYAFNGWYSDIALTAAYAFTAIPAENVSLYAKWEVNQYIISFDSLGGSNVDSVTQDYNTQVSEPEPPLRKGYTFDGWFLDETLENSYIFTIMPAENIFLYAHWSPNLYDVTFIYNSSQEDQVITTYADSEIDMPSYENHLFTNWYIDEDLSIIYESDKFPLEDMTLYAGWALNVYDYVVMEDEVWIMKYTGNEISILIPKYIQRLPVTKIQSRAFSVSFAQEIYLPDYVKTIEEYAFSELENVHTFHIGVKSKLENIGSFGVNLGFSSVLSIYIPEYLTIGHIYSAFNLGYSGHYLTEYVVHPSNLKYASVDDVLYSKDLSILYSYPRGKTSLTYQVLDDVKIIKGNAFLWVPYLEEITFTSNSKLHTVEKNAFHNIGNLKKIILPKDVSTLESGFLFYSSKLETIEFTELSTFYKISDNILYDFQFTRLLLALPSNSGVLNVPDSVIEIADYALIKTKYSSVVFSENSQLNTFGEVSLGFMDYLSEVNIPQYVTNFSSSAISNSYHVTQIAVDKRNFVYESIDNVLFNKIESRLILYPPNLDTLQYVIPKEVRIIGSWAFQHALINEIRFETGSEIWKIESYAFYSNIKRIYIPDTVTSVSASAYYANVLMTQTMIYVQHISKPEGWDDSWALSAAYVVWGYEDQIYG